MDGKPPPPKRSDLPPLPNAGSGLGGKPKAPAAKPAGPQAFQCPSCGAAVKIRAMGSSLSVACGSCGSVLDAKDPNHAILSKAHNNLRILPIMALGTRGKLRGVLWEVIGFMQRADGSGQYTWREYLLFNPAQGFRWLVEAQGHWNYVVPLHERPKRAPSGTSAVALGKHYRHFLSGQAVVKYVYGEFYWRVKVGDTVTVADYVAPPEILSVERDKSEETFSIGEYVSADDVAKAFAIERPMPAQVGVAPNQPSIYDGDASLNAPWGAFIAVLFFIMLLTAMFAPSALVDVSPFAWSNANPSQTFSTPSFEIKSTTNLEIKLGAAVNNQWFEINGDLVDEADGDTEEFELGVEYYSGYDSDGSWTEGSQRNSRILSSIKPGKYHLNLQGSSDAQSMNFSVEIVRGVPIWSNFFLILLLVSAYPAFMFWRRQRFETERWSGSDYAGDDE